MTKDEALRLALEALEYEAQKGNDNAYQSEREAIKAALEAKDEPVAWAHYTTFNNLNTFEKSRFTATLSKKETNACCVALYTAPQRTWVGLTNEEISAIDWKSNETLHDFARAIEAKLKEKNT
jgi:hypothetical protein